MLVRIDAIGGFDAPSKSVSMSIKGNSDDILKTEDIQKDIDRFSKVLGKHTEVTSKDDTKH
jgi:hypothetical protein